MNRAERMRALPDWLLNEVGSFQAPSSDFFVWTVASPTGNSYDIYRQLNHKMMDAGESEAWKVARYRRHPVMACRHDTRVTDTLISALEWIVEEERFYSELPTIPPS